MKKIEVAVVHPRAKALDDNNIPTREIVETKTLWLLYKFQIIVKASYQVPISLPIENIIFINHGYVLINCAFYILSYARFHPNILLKVSFWSPECY